MVGRTKSKGFTIAEILIVVVVIAILVAISIIAYTTLQSRGHDSAMQADLRNIGQKVAEFTVENGRPPLANGTELGPILKVNKKSYLETAPGAAQTTLLYCRTNTEWGFVGRSKGGQSWVVENGSLQQIGNWGGGSDSNACGSNTNVGFVYGAEPGYGYTNLYRGGTWQSWVAD